MWSFVQCSWISTTCELLSWFSSYSLLSVFTRYLCAYRWEFRVKCYKLFLVMLCGNAFHSINLWLSKKEVRWRLHYTFRYARDIRSDIFFLLFLNLRGHTLVISHLFKCKNIHENGWGVYLCESFDYLVIENSSFSLNSNITKEKLTKEKEQLFSEWNVSFNYRY